MASAAGTIHALADAVLGDGLAVGGTGILAASVGMDDGTFQTRISGCGVFQRPDAQLRMEEAVPLCKALVAGGLPTAEVTFRTACAEDCICALAKEVPQHVIDKGGLMMPGVRGTNSVDRAVYHLGRQGVEFIEDSRVTDAKDTKAL